MIQVLDKFSYYCKKYQVISRAHHLTASRYARYNNFLGIPVVVFTAITGTAIFATLNSSPETFYKVIVGTISLLAAILSGLQFFLEFSKKTEAHKNAGTQYSIIKRQFDTAHLTYSSTENPDKQQALAELTALLEQVDKLAIDMPSVPDKFYTQAKQEYSDETE